MYSNKSILHVILCSALCAFGGNSAYAEYEPNDNYSTLVLSYQSSTFVKPVCIGNDCHEGLSGPAAVFARQLIPNFALGLAGSYLQSSGSSSTINSTNGAVFAEAIAGLGSSADVGLYVAMLGTTMQKCQLNPNSCTSTSDSGNDLGVFGKVFLNDMRSLSVGLSYDVISYKNSPNQSVVVLSLVTILARHHRLALSLDRVRDSDGNPLSGGYGLAYSYLVF